LANLSDPLAKALLMSTLASGAPLKVVKAFSDVLRDADKKTLEELASLRTFGGKGQKTASAGGTPYIQRTDTTCGPTSLIALVAAKDPLVAYWLVSGKTIDGYLPPYLETLDLSGIIRPQDGGPGCYVDLTDTERRMKWLEEAVQDRANEVWPDTKVWPDALGITPYGAKAELGKAGLSYEVVWSDESALDFLPEETTSLHESLNRAADAINRGEPVPLLVGSIQDSIEDVKTPGVPRHYVLAVGYHDGVFDVYEPSSGETRQISKADMETAQESGQAAYGGWYKLHSMLLPAA
jgi:hypothetical protein